MEALAARTPHLAKYEILGEVGHGGMATVYRAMDKRLGREVAIKVIHPHLRDSSEAVARFHAEARAVAKLRHPNIVELFDISEPDEPEQYLVAELVRGTTLRKVLESSRAMPAEVAAALSVELLEALEHAHRAGVVHRDVKPENVLLAPTAAVASSADVAVAGASGSGLSISPERRQQAPALAATDRVVVKLTDFGIAKLLDAQRVTSTGQVLGSPAHMAPEQIECGAVDARADVFGMGVLFYECTIGHLPFDGGNPAQVLRAVLEGRYAEARMEQPTIGGRWSALIDRALAHAPADRFADAGTMRDALLSELERLGVSSPARELAAWFDDPVTYETKHAAAMVDRLCALGDDARKRGDVLSAADDYNRALALAPNDGRLVRIVARMKRAEARARFFRRAGVAFVAAASALALALGAGRFVRTYVHNTDRSARQPPVVDSPMGSRLNASPPTSDSPSATAAAPSRVPTLLPSAAPKAVERTLTLDLTPAMGVTVSVDGFASRRVNTGDSLVVDGRAHTLTFACEVCTQVRRDVVAADKDDTLKIVVPIKPAALVIEGDVDKTYQIVQHPEVVVRAGTNTVSLGSAYERVTVQQVETKVAIPVRLQAGKSVHATF
jgi:serine/threonine protein kinase